MRRACSLLAVVLSLALMTGCSGDRSPGVEKTIWILESLADESLHVRAYGHVMPHAELQDGTVSGNLGLNSFSGTGLGHE